MLLQCLVSTDLPISGTKTQSNRGQNMLQWSLTLLGNPAALQLRGFFFLSQLAVDWALIFFPCSLAEGDCLDVHIWPCDQCLTTQPRLCSRPAGSSTGSASDCSFLSLALSCQTAAFINAPQSSPQLHNYYLSLALIVPTVAAASSSSFCVCAAWQPESEEATSSLFKGK